MNTLTCAHKDEFWNAVADCLVEFHDRPRTSAKAEARTLRTRIERLPEGSSDELIYHEEPFQLACDLAGRQLDLARHRSKYDGILRRHGW